MVTADVLLTVCEIFQLFSPTVFWLWTLAEEHPATSTQSIHRLKLITWATILSLTPWVYLLSFSRCWLPKSTKSLEFPRKFDLLAGQDHPRSSILVPIESACATIIIYPVTAGMPYIFALSLAQIPSLHSRREDANKRFLGQSLTLPLAFFPCYLHKEIPLLLVHCESKKTATFIFTVTLANVGRFLNSFNVGIRKKWLITRIKNFPP